MRVTSLELHQKLGQTIDRARLEPVVVTKHDRDHVVILAAEEYARRNKPCAGRDHREPDAARADTRCIGSRSVEARSETLFGAAGDGNRGEERGTA